MRPFPLLLLFCVLLWSIPAQAERLISRLSTDSIEITSSYDGERITFFGNVEPELGADQRHVEGPFHVIVVVRGPAMHRVAREKTRRFGIWLNTDEVMFRHFPSFFHVIASGRLAEITDPETLAEEAILPEIQPARSAAPGQPRADHFGRELVRLMSERGFFGVHEYGVHFLSETFYSAWLSLPSDAPPGNYVATTYVFKAGELVARRSEGFIVRKTGFERFLALSAVQQPFLYGLACVALALFTGWLGGVVFRR